VIGAEVLHLTLSIDETLHEVVESIRRTKARRLVIDSLSGFELARAPTFREDFRESLYRMVTVLTGMGITMVMTAGIGGRVHGSALQPSRHRVSD
jgi:circadian clock protein KaiC